MTKKVRAKDYSLDSLKLLSLRCFSFVNQEIQVLIDKALIETEPEEGFFVEERVKGRKNGRTAGRTETRTAGRTIDQGTVSVLILT